MASSAAVTPLRRSEDVAKFKLTIRDAILLLIGCVGMYGAQVARDFGLRSDIRNLQTAFEASVSQQSNTNIVIQRQIDDWRGETKLNRVNAENTAKELAELKGILLGTGIKGVTKK